MIDEKIEARLVRLLSESGKTVATSESCTGGLLSKRITDIAGSSAVFGYGVCTYANEAKEKLLSVRHETLETHGAVSPETALEMARGMLRLSGADIAVSTTGIAGPDGGTAQKPVGLVYTAVAAKDGRETVKELRLGNIENACRDTIRSAAADEALLLVYETLLSSEKSEKST